MKIRKTELFEVDILMNIYEYARKFMAENGNPHQWGETKWPPKHVLINDIENGRSFVCVNDNNEILGTFCYMYGINAEPTYNNIENGKWSKDIEYGVVHRIASNGTKGVGTFCLNWAYEQCKYLRIDTHPDNKVMQNLLKKLGFKQCGEVHVVEDDNIRLAFEK